MCDLHEQASTDQGDNGLGFQGLRVSVQDDGIADNRVVRVLGRVRYDRGMNVLRHWREDEDTQGHVDGLPLIARPLGPFNVLSDDYILCD